MKKEDVEFIIKNTSPDDFLDFSYMEHVNPELVPVVRSMAALNAVNDVFQELNLPKVLA